MTYMTRPWQVWLLFLLCLATGLPAMTWLTVKVIELDRSEAVASARADLEEEISLALWRMDSLVTPILATEAVRPYRAYFPSGAAGKDGEATSDFQPSPLLTNRPPNVMLHFQCSVGAGGWSSPQNPTGVACQVAVAQGVSMETINANAKLLETLKASLGDIQFVDRLVARQDDVHAPRLSAWVNSSRPGLTMPPAPEGISTDDDADTDDSAEDRAAGFGGIYKGYGQLAEEQSQSRGKREFGNRLRAMQSYAQNAVTIGQNSDPQLAGVFRRVTQGVSQPLWVGSHLLFARRVIVDNETLVQGSWLDWPRIKKMLLAEARRLPKADLVPVSQPKAGNPARMLATLPVRLVVAEPAGIPASWSPIRLSLWLAWICLLTATLAFAALLLGVVRLSERRAAFVSAVTHELRTPLTTFRMYSEMLAEDMVPDAEKRKRYLHTLRAEADRLWHLVENVFAYARLERGRSNGSREQVTVESLVERLQPRLADHARQAGMQMSFSVTPSCGQVSLRTSVTTVEQILFNLVDNACKYAADADDRSIEVFVSATEDAAEFRVRDHGPGISGNRLRSLFRPFSKSAEEAAHSAPGIGLGLSLCKGLAQDLGGRLKLVQKDGEGAEFVLQLPLN